MMDDAIGTMSSNPQCHGDAIDLHKELCDYKTNHNCGDKIETQTGQWSEGQLGPLASTADVKANSYSTLYNRRRYTHCNTNTYNDDVNDVSGTSNLFKLPISYIKSNLGRLRDAAANIGIPSASARDATATIGVPSASAPDHISNLGYVFASVPNPASTAAPP